MKNYRNILQNLKYQLKSTNYFQICIKLFYMFLNILIDTHFHIYFYKFCEFVFYLSFFVTYLKFCQSGVIQNDLLIILSSYTIVFSSSQSQSSLFWKNAITNRPLYFFFHLLVTFIIVNK